MNEGLRHRASSTESAVRVDHLACAWTWVLRLREAGVSQDDLAEWLCWYEADEAHKTAFEEMQAFWRNSGDLLQGPGALTVSQLLGPAPSPTAPRPQSTWRKRAPLIALSALAAAAACAITALVGWSWLESGMAGHAVPTTQAEPTVRQTVLPDGSRVELAPKSSLEVHFTSRERALALDDGEAYFSVVHNRQRPFVVAVGQLRVYAVGTAFNIRKAADRVAIAVTEGVVEVTTHARGSSESVRITADSEATWEAGSAAALLAAADSQRTLAWREGRLDYIDEPLSSVIADVNRYTQRPVVIRDAAVGRITFSGTVFTNATEVWLHALPRVFPVELRSDTDGEWVLTSTASR